MTVFPDIPRGLSIPPSYFLADLAREKNGPWMTSLVERTPDLSGAVMLALVFLELENPDNAEILRAAIVAEWPTVSSEDSGQIAYTRTPEHGELNRRTRTGPARWLGRVLPGVFTGRAIDSLIAAHGSCQETLVFLSGENMVDHMKTARAASPEFGFNSCMTNNHQIRTRPHPYTVYSEDLGWKIAVLISGGENVARIMTNGKKFINKAYGRNSIFMDSIKSALIERGFQSVASWMGHDIRAIREDSTGGWVGPYLDGYAIYGDLNEDETLFRITDRDTGYEFHELDGYVKCEESREGMVETDNGEWIDEEDAVYIDNHGYVSADDARQVNGEWYLDSDCVWLFEEQEHGLRSDCVRVRGSWYSEESDSICYDGISGRYILAEDAVELEDGETTHMEAAIYLENEDVYILAEDAARIDGEWFRKSECIRINGRYFQPGDLSGLDSALVSVRSTYRGPTGIDGKPVIRVNGFPIDSFSLAENIVEFRTPDGWQGHRFEGME